MIDRDPHRSALVPSRRTRLRLRARTCRIPPRPESSTVTVVVLNWNGWRDTLACLDALDKATLPPAHVVVVDNGSSDDSVARIRAARPAADVVETGRNLGFAGGCNVGIRRALESKASLIWLLNNDTLPAPSALEAMVRVAESDGRIGLVGSVLRYMDAPNRVQAWGGARIDWLIGIPRHCRDAREAARADYIVGASLLVKAAVFEQVGLLDEEFFLYWEDADFALRARAAGWRIAVADESVVLHREGASASGGAPRPSLQAELHHIRSLGRFVRKHSRAWAAPLLVRGLLEIPNKLRHGQPERIGPVLRAFADALRGSIRTAREEQRHFRAK